MSKEFKKLRIAILTAVIVASTGLAIAIVQGDTNHNQSITPQIVLPSSAGTKLTGTPINEQAYPTPDTQPSSAGTTDTPITVQPGQDITSPTMPSGTSADQPAVVVDSPPPVTVTDYDMHFVDVSPANHPNTVAQQYCDYTYSDGTTMSQLKITITQQFKQPISSYNKSSPPTNYGEC